MTDREVVPSGAIAASSIAAFGVPGNRRFEPFQNSNPTNIKFVGD
jgi:hypothetical protein